MDWVDEAEGTGGKDLDLVPGAMGVLRNLNPSSAASSIFVGKPAESLCGKKPVPRAPF